MALIISCQCPGIIASRPYHAHTMCWMAGGFHDKQTVGREKQATGGSDGQLTHSIDYFSVYYYTKCVSLKLICASLNVKLCIFKNHFT